MIKKHLPPIYLKSAEKTSVPIDRRVFLERTIGLLVGAGIVASCFQSATAAEKYSKADVNYQDTPKDGQSCANCKFWDGAGGCEIVEGEIAEDTWCSVWVEV